MLFRWKDKPIKIKSQGKKNERKDQHQMYNIGHTNNVIQHNIVGNSQVGVKIGQDIIHGLVSK